MITSMIPVEPILFLLIASYNNNFRLIYWAFKDFYRKIDTYVIYNNNYYFRQNSMSENHNFIADKAENNFRHCGDLIVPSTGQVWSNVDECIV